MGLDDNVATPGDRRGAQELRMGGDQDRNSRATFSGSVVSWLGAAAGIPWAGWVGTR